MSVLLHLKHLCSLYIAKNILKNTIFIKKITNKVYQLNTHCLLLTVMINSPRLVYYFLDIHIHRSIACQKQHLFLLWFTTINKSNGTNEATCVSDTLQIYGYNLTDMRETQVFSMSPYSLWVPVVWIMHYKQHYGLPTLFLDNQLR